MEMKHIKLFESWLSENEDQQKEKIRKKVEGKPGARTIMSMYKFYMEGGHKDIKDPKELLAKIEYYDQKIREDKIWDLAQSAGISPRTVDKMNLEMVKPFIGKVKPGTDEFSHVWIVVQHADHDLSTQKKFIEIYGEDMKKTNANDLLFLKDRISANEDKPQEGLSQGMKVTYNGKTGWLPYQNANLKYEPEEITAKNELGKEVKLLKWKDGETSKVNDMIKAVIGEKGVEVAKNAGLEINLKNYVIHHHNTEYVGPYVIKK